MILEEETFKRWGYYPKDLKPKSSKRVLAACDDCGKVRVTTKQAYSPFCRLCVLKGERSYNWKGGKVKRICEACGKEFEVMPYEIKRGKGRFCSKSCANKGENGNNWQGGKVKRICEPCGKEFEINPATIERGYGRFCSLSCARKTRTGENSPCWKGGLVKRNCEVCGKEFEAEPSRIKKGWGTFCSHLCARKARKSFPQNHTKPEKIWQEIAIDKHSLPFKYTGDGHFWIGEGKDVINPDFIHLTKKIVVEIFSYWHDPLRRHCKVRYSATYEGRKKILKKYGWQLIVFWESDLKRKDAEAFVLSELKKEGIIK